MPRLLILFLVACIVYAQHNTKDATRILKKRLVNILNMVGIIMDRGILHWIVKRAS